MELAENGQVIQPQTPLVIFVWLLLGSLKALCISQKIKIEQWPLEKTSSLIF